MPRPVTAWEAFDGSLWRTEDEAEENERSRELEAALSTLNDIRCRMSGKSFQEGVRLLVLEASRISSAADTIIRSGTTPDQWSLSK